MSSLEPYYNRELAFLRGLTTQFADDHKKVAGRMRVGPQRIGDPHAERLVQPRPAAPLLRVLDIGCGPGTSAFALADVLGADVSITGVDLSQPMVARARDHHRAGPPRPQVRFAVGDAVRVRVLHPPGHTRVPRYVRGKAGRVVHVAPAFPYPDASAHAGPARSEATYHVAFESRDLWGPDAEEAQVVVDLWDSYLEPVDG